MQNSSSCFNLALFLDLGYFCALLLGFGIFLYILQYSTHYVMCSICGYVEIICWHFKFNTVLALFESSNPSRKTDIPYFKLWLLKSFQISTFALFVYLDFWFSQAPSLSVYQQELIFDLNYIGFMCNSNSISSIMSCDMTLYFIHTARGLKHYSFYDWICFSTISWSCNLHIVTNAIVKEKPICFKRHYHRAILCDGWIYIWIEILCFQTSQ